MNIKTVTNIWEQLKQVVKKRRFIAIAFIVLLVVGTVLWRQSQNSGELEKTATVKRQRLTETISASGEVKAKNSAQLRFPTPSKVVWVGVKKGDIVRKGQGLASLDKRQLEKNLKKKLLSYMNERWDFEQTNDDYDIEGRRLDEVILTDAEKRIAEKAQFDLDNSVLDVEIADLAAKEAVMVSPIAGEITAIKGVTTGEQLVATSLANSYINVVDFSSLHFVAQVDEADYGKIKVGQKVEIVLDSFADEIFEGTVFYIGREGGKTAGGGVTIPIDIQFNPNTESLAVGLNGDAEFIIEEKESVLVVPKEYVKAKNGESIVYILKDGKPEEKKVTTGLSTLSQIEIAEGLAEGEEIVLVKNNKK